MTKVVETIRRVLHGSPEPHRRAVLDRFAALAPIPESSRMTTRRVELPKVRTIQDWKRRYAS